MHSALLPNFGKGANYINDFVKYLTRRARAICEQIVNNSKKVLTNHSISGII